MFRLYFFSFFSLLFLLLALVSRISGLGYPCLLMSMWAGITGPEAEITIMLERLLETYCLGSCDVATEDRLGLIA